MGSKADIYQKGGNNTVRPVTVKQIVSADQAHPDSDFQIDGHEVGSVSSPFTLACSARLIEELTIQVMLVGSVRNFGTSATNVNYEIGDGTGYVDVRQWLDSADDEAGKMAGIG